ncbi:exonuclease V, chloroplastic [Olea europaea subsp. europaea]|uniref:Exonuclease V, chloroplastic n=1 Tax=Olea europaea subsp. europaea TaxID=158383 RepID=A0A8S0TZN6_OLEEU|nr:exonuclease V, chloroplastic [Olea europaea subsp. europaea]
MTESPAPPPPPTSSTATKIPQEIISGEGMALIDAAFASAAQSLRNPSCIQSKTPKPTATVSSPDIEDSGRVDWDSSPLKKRNIGPDSLLHRFRQKRSLFVTDITATDWCEKETEFSLLFGGPKMTKAIKEGSARHLELEKELIINEKVPVKSDEEVWALNFLNFIVGANQLMSKGRTRELKVVGFVEGIWMTGKIDEIRVLLTGSERYATLVETKTREQRKLPGEPQRRNGRLQMMCYKYLWDSLVDDKFPLEFFFDFFSLKPNYMLSSEIIENMAKSGIASEVRIALKKKKVH